MDEIELTERAFTELVDDMMLGYEFPRRALTRQINLLHVLMVVDRYELVQAVYKAVTDAPEDLTLDVAKLVNAYFEGEGNHYVLAKAEELRRECEREREDARTEAKLLAREGTHG
jgi:hypothetical protein